MHPRHNINRYLILWCFLGLSLGLTQAQTPAPTPLSEATSSTASEVLAHGASPEAVADEAIKAWQARFSSFSLDDSLARLRQTLSRDPEQALTVLDNVCAEFNALGTDPFRAPGITQMKINLTGRRALDSPDEVTKRFIYPGEISEQFLTRVFVEVVQTPDGLWEAKHVEMDTSTGAVRLPRLFVSPLSGWLFLLFSVWLMMMALRQSYIQSLLAQGVLVIQEHRRLVIITIVMLYSTMLLGFLWATLLPPQCHLFITSLLSSTLDQIGIYEVAQTGDVKRFAGAIAYWNFTMGALSTTFVPALFLGVPAYLLQIARFFVLGMPFSSMLEPQLLLHLPVFIIELLAYILVTAGGGMLLISVIKRGFRGYSEGVRKLWLMLLWALVLLVIGAWYEAIELLWLVPALF